MAIAFDASSTAGSGGVSVQSVSHTCSGTNRLLIVGIFEQDNNTVTGVTYNGTALTFLNSAQVGGFSERCYLYYLANPDSGTHDIVASRSSTTGTFQLRNISLTGVDQSSPVSNNDTLSTNSANPGTVTMTAEEGDWAFAMVRNPVATTNSSDSNFSNRFAAISFSLFDSNGTISAGSYTGSFTAGSAAAWGIAAATVRKASVAAGTDNAIFFGGGA